MGPILFAAVISTIHLSGAIDPAGGNYVVVPFDVPAGTVEFEIARTVTPSTAVLDFGVWSPSGFRGWGGGLTDPTTIGVADSSRGYLPGPVASGSGWQLVIGKARLPAQQTSYTVDVTFRDAATLTPRPRAPYSPVVLATGARWYKGDLHVHDIESGDAEGTIPQIIALARSRHLDFVVFSDHNTISQQSLLAAIQPSVPDLLLVRGDEITTYGGHGGGLGISSYVDHRIGLSGRTAAQMVHDVVAQGGVFIVNHPMLDLGNACIGCAWTYDDAWTEAGAMEVQTGNFQQFALLFFDSTIALWDKQLDRGLHLAAVGGSDDHRAGMGTGSSPAEVGTPTTLVWADQLSEQAIIDGVRAGRTEVALRGPDDPLVELTTIGKDPQSIGGTATGAHIEVEAHVTGGNGYQLALVQDGVKQDPIAVDSADWRHRVTIAVAKTGSRVRAQLVGPDGNTVVVTSHIWLTYAPEVGGCALGGGGGEGAAIAIGILLLGLLEIRRRRAST